MCCLVVAAAATACRALDSPGRAEAFLACMRDFDSKELCTCAEEEIDRRFNWLQARTFRVRHQSPNEAPGMAEVVKVCAARVHLSHWPKSSLQGLRSACKGPEATCRCMEGSVSRQIDFATVADRVAAGKLEEDPQFKAAMQGAVRECPEAFVAEDAPWPESAVGTMVENCVKGNEANRSYCECLSKRVSKKLKFVVLLRVGAGDEKANEEMETVVRELAPDCMNHQPVPRTHRRERER
jgi:hypothetical protein